MRLIDADALLDVFLEWPGDVITTGWATARIEEVPTVRCGECFWFAEDGQLSDACADCWCGSEFERREP